MSLILAIISILLAAFLRAWHGRHNEGVIAIGKADFQHCYDQPPSQCGHAGALVIFFASDH